MIRLRSCDLFFPVHYFEVRRKSVWQYSEYIELALCADVDFSIGNSWDGKLYSIAGGASPARWTAVQGDCNGFTSLHDARRTIEEWRQDYNQQRPHS